MFHGRRKSMLALSQFIVRKTYLNFLNIYLPLIDYDALQTTTRLYEEQTETALP